MAGDSRLNDIVQSEYTSIGIHSAVDGSIVVPKLRVIIEEPAPAEFDRVRYVERMVDAGDGVHRVRIQKGYKGASVQDYHLEHKPESFL
jgi:hypothetical protein